MLRRYGIAIALLGVLAIALVAAEAFSHKNHDSARAAPPFPTKVLHPPRVTVASLRGRPAIVHFWASWCGPCIREAPELAALPAKLHGRAALVGIDWSDNVSNAATFIARHHWTFPNLVDANGKAGNDYRLLGLPTTFLLDARGRIVARLTGPQTAHGLLSRLESV